MKFFTNSIMLVLFALAVVSCNKDDKEQDNKAGAEAFEEVAMSLNFDEEMGSIGAMGMEGDVEQKTSAPGSVFTNCATLSLDSGNGMYTLTIDFGSTNCQSADGKYRRGKIMVSYEHNPFDAGSVHTITADGYAVNDYELNGTRTVTYRGLNGANDPYSDLSVTLTITKPDGKTISWNSTRQNVWVEGFGDFDPFNNAIEVTGSASGVTAGGVSFNVGITQALRVEATCSNIVSGTLDISGPSFDTRTVDYGNGDCDRKASLTVNGNTTTFLLK